MPVGVGVSGALADVDSSPVAFDPGTEVPVMFMSMFCPPGDDAAAEDDDDDAVEPMESTLLSQWKAQIHR